MASNRSDANSSGSSGINWTSQEIAKHRGRGRARRTALQGPATELMLQLAGVRTCSRVLDVAAGTGDQTLMAAQRVGPTGYVLATDLSSSMLELAADAAREASLTNIETRVMDAENIDLDPDSFDTVRSPAHHPWANSRPDSAVEPGYRKNEQRNIEAQETSRGVMVRSYANWASSCSPIQSTFYAQCAE